MTQIRPNIKTGNWKLSKHEFYTAYHYSLQYHEWEDKCRGIVGISALNMDGMPRGSTTSNPTERQGIAISEYQHKMYIIEQTIKETDEQLYPWLLKAVTCEDITYNYLKQVMNIPCGKNIYYDRRRKFYYLLSQKLNTN